MERMKYGQREYRVRWLGWDEEDNSRELRETVEDTIAFRLSGSRVATLPARLDADSVRHGIGIFASGVYELKRSPANMTIVATHGPSNTLLLRDFRYISLLLQDCRFA